MNAPAPNPAATAADPTLRMPPVHEPGARPSATVVVLRDGAQGLEVLTVRRAVREGDQNSGATVFPGGLLDAGDLRIAAALPVRDAADAAEARLGLPYGARAFWVAALRECFEETGLWLGGTGPGSVPEAQRLRLRDDVHAGRIGVDAAAAQARLGWDLGRLHYFDHWVTPRGLPKIFDTRFFLAAAPDGMAAVADGHESAAVEWLRPADALDAARGLKLLQVTQTVLRRLAGWGSVAEALDAVRRMTEVPLQRPRLGRGADGRTRPIGPDHRAFEELGRVDPEGRAAHPIDLTVGVPVALGPHVLRITAGNGNLMTGPGTNSYLLGRRDAPGEGWVIVDPGPMEAAHVDALMAALPGPLRSIVVTHTHPDHSPAAVEIARRTGAPVAGRIATHATWQDPTFRPDRILGDGDVVDTAAGPLRVLHTPGHASNHLCLLLECEGLLFTGDHLMQGTTVVINPPDGDMAAYLASLERLLREPIQALAPGHGFLMTDVEEVVRRTIAHRLAREQVVLDRLADAPADAEGQRFMAEDALLEAVYRGTPKALMPVARRSLRAHLLKLLADGLVRPRGALEAGGTGAAEGWARVERALG